MIISKNFLLYAEAQEIVSKLKIESSTFWKKYCNSGNKPENIPARPDKYYKYTGWKSWDFWLGKEAPKEKKTTISNDDKNIYFHNKIIEIALEKGGTIINGIYQNKRSVYKIVCANGHIWETEVQNLINGCWCQKCWVENKAGVHLKLQNGLELAKELAISRKGECLSDTFSLASKKLVWKCCNGHIWEAVYSDIRKGAWCPECKGGVRERLCRHYFQTITNHQFPKKRLSWLKNDRGNVMELDGYCEELNLAFEHHGKQHYDILPHFQRRDESLSQRKSDDELKESLCNDNNIKLIVISYDVDLPDLSKYIYNILNDLYPLNNFTHYSEIENIYIPSNELEELNNICKTRGGECLSPVYLGSDKKHKFVCSEGHTWEAVPSNIKSERATWCPTCKPERIGDSNRKHSIESMQKLAESKGGKYLSDEYKSVNFKYKWQCAEGHEWEAAPAEIMRGSWCRKCNSIKMKDTIESMYDVARLKGGECLSTIYDGAQNKLLWRCGNGHEWYAKPGNVKNNNSWCPVCSGRKP